MNSISVKTQLILYLASFALILAIKDKDAAFLLSTLVATFSAMAIEAFILYIKTNKLKVAESAIITGLIIGFVLSSEEPLWKFVLASGLAIFSKYLIFPGRKHIFNPAGLGIFLTLVIFGAYTQWKGTYIWYVLLPFGLYFCHKTRKMEIIIGYALVSLTLFGIQAMLQRVSLTHIFGYLSYFYIFVMVIEPKTTPIKPLGKFIFGSGVAALIFILTERGVKFDAELFSLLLMNATVPLLNKLSLKGGRI